jgi:curli biogenesis system outer membrane secretion channel CsgG
MMNLAHSLLALMLLAATQAEGKPVLAVLKFQDETGAMPMQGGAGRALTTMLTNELAARAAFTVVERQKLRAVLEEQALSESGHVEGAEGAALGKLLGADYLVTGTVTAFEEKIEEKIKSGFFGGNARVQQISHGGYLAVDLRVIDASTGAIAAARTVEGFTEGGTTEVSGSRSGMELFNDGPDARAVRAAAIEVIDYLECVLVQRDECIQAFESKDQKRIEATKKAAHIR